MAEFITIQRAGGPIQMLNLDLITRCVAHVDGGSATVSFDIDSIEIHGRSEVAQLMDGITRASEARPVAAQIKNRLINLVGELRIEKGEGPICNMLGLERAIAHIQQIVDQYDKALNLVAPPFPDTEPDEPVVQAVVPTAPCCGAYGEIIGEDERGSAYAAPCKDCPEVNPCR